MPRKSPFTFFLTDSERDTLESADRGYTSPYKDVIREKIILMAEQGLDNDEISSRLDTPGRVVSKWRKRFYESDLQGLQDQPRFGRPGSFSPCNNR